MVKRIFIILILSVMIFSLIGCYMDKSNSDNAIEEIDVMSQKELQALREMEDYNKNDKYLDEGYGKNRDMTQASDDTELKESSTLNTFSESTAQSRRLGKEEIKPEMTSWLTYNIEIGDYEEAFYEIEYTKENLPIYTYSYSKRGQDKDTKYISTLVPQVLVDAKYVLIPHGVEVSESMKKYFDDNDIAWIQTNEFTDTSLMEDGRTYNQTILEDTVANMIQTQSSVAKLNTDRLNKYQAKENARVTENWLQNQIQIAKTSSSYNDEVRDKDGNIINNPQNDGDTKNTTDANGNVINNSKNSGELQDEDGNVIYRPKNLEHPEAKAYVIAYDMLKDYTDDYTKYTDNETTKKAIEYYDMSLNNEFSLSNMHLWIELSKEYNDLCLIQVGGITKVLKRSEATKLIKDTYKKRREIMDESPTERDFIIDTWGLEVKIPHTEKNLNDIKNKEVKNEDKQRDKYKKTRWNSN